MTGNVCQAWQTPSVLLRCCEPSEDVNASRTGNSRSSAETVLVVKHPTAPLSGLRRPDCCRTPLSRTPPEAPFRACDLSPPDRRSALSFCALGSGHLEALESLAREFGDQLEVLVHVEHGQLRELGGRGDQ